MPKKTVLYAVESARFKGGDVSGYLMTMDGELVHSHMPSSPTFLRADLTTNFGRAAALTERFGEHDVVYVGLDDSLPLEIAHHFNSPDEV